MKKLLVLFCLILCCACFLCACGKDPTPVSVQSVALNEDGEAIVTLTDGSVHHAGTPTYSHSHAFGDWIDYSAVNSTVSCDARVYYRACTGCGDLEWRTGGDHAFETVTVPATCTATGTETRTCTACGTVETKTLDLTPHPYQTAYSYNGAFHWYNCSACDAVKDKAEHASGDDGLCAACGQPTGPTEGIVYMTYDDHAEVLGYTGTAAKILIADTYGDLPVTVIGANAFKQKSITSVIIPTSVTSIGVSAFYDCDSLTLVTFAENSQLTSIGGFSDCDSLTSITIPASVTSIGVSAFYDCGKLTSVTFAENSQLTSIGECAFYDCYSLTSVTFAENSQLTSIGECAFYDCYSLTSITIPASVTSIGDGAFYGCDSLTSITIPASVTSIGWGAFSGCVSLASVNFESKNGWAAGSTAISADHLSDPALAAIYLTSTYTGSTWSRTDTNDQS